MVNSIFTFLIVNMYYLFFYCRDSKNERQRAKRHSLSDDVVDFVVLELRDLPTGPTLVLLSKISVLPTKPGCEIARFVDLKELKQININN